MTIIFIFLFIGLANLLSQSDCYNLDFANKSWFDKDSIIKVEDKINLNNYSLNINERISNNFSINGEIVDIQIFDILGRKLEGNFNINNNRIDIEIQQSLENQKIVLISFSILERKGIKFFTIKQLLF